MDNEAVIYTQLDTSGVVTGIQEVGKLLDDLAKKGASINIGNKRETSDAQNLNKVMQDLEKNLDNYIKKAQSSDMGAAQFEQVQKEINDTRKVIDYLNEQWTSGNDAFFANTNVEKLDQQITSVKDKMQQLEQMKKQSGFNRIFDNLSEAAKNSVSNIKKAWNALRSSIASGVKTLKNGFSSVISNLKKIAVQQKSTFGRGIKSVLAYALGIGSLVMLFNKLRQAISVGMKNLVRYDDTTNASVSSLTSALATLKNALATAFAPILNVISPILTTFINQVISAVNAIGMLIAKLTGAGTFVKATAIQQDYAASLDKTAGAAKKAKGALAKFDELDVLEKKDSGGGAGTSPADMFETVDLSDYSSGIADLLTQAINTGDFTNVGHSLGLALKDALDNIDWASIQAGARKLAHELATFINGFVEVEGLDVSIGTTIAEALNTAVDFAEEFVDTLKWEKIGKFLGGILNSTFDKLDLKQAAETIAKAVNGMATTVSSFMTTAEWENIGYKIGEFIKGVFDPQTAASVGTAIANTINAAGNFVKGVFENKPISGILTAVSSGLNAAIKDINTKTLGSDIADIIGDAATGISKFMKETDWDGVGQKAVEFLEGFFSDEENFKAVAEAFADTFVAALKTFASFGSCLVDWVEGDNGLSFSEEWQIITDTFTQDKDIFFDAVKDMLFDGFKTALLGQDGSLEAFNLGWDFLKTWWADIKAKISRDLDDFFGNGILGFITSWFDNDFGNAWRLGWDTIKSWFAKDTGDISTQSSTFLSGLISKITEWWNKIKNWFGSAKQFVNDSLNTVKRSFYLAFEGIKTIIKNAWNFTAGTINSWISGFETMCNGLVNAINKMIDALNSISFSIPDWVPELGGKSFSMNLSTISSVSLPRVPMLAQGTVVPRQASQFAAILGDNNQETEVVSPLSTMKEAMLEALGEINMGGGDVYISAEGDMDAIVRLFKFKLDNESSRVGRSFVKANA